MTEVTKLTKKNRNVLLTILGVGIIAAGLFYWYQWRPSEIRKECSQIRDESINNVETDLLDTPGRFVLKSSLTKDERIKTKLSLIKVKYDNCLSEKGLD